MTKNAKTNLSSASWLRLVRDISGSFNFASRDVEQTVALLLKKLLQELGASAIAVWTYDEETKFMKIEAAAGLDPLMIRYFNKTDRMRVGRGIVGMAMAKRKTYFSIFGDGEIPHVLPRWREIIREQKFSAIIAAPMFVGENIVGTFAVYYKKKKPKFISGETQFIEIVANQLAITIENIKSYKTVEFYSKNLFLEVERLSQLQNIAQSLSLSAYKSIDEPLLVFYGFLKDKFSIEGLGIFEPDEKKEFFKLSASVGLSSDHRSFVETNPYLVGPGTLVGLAFQERDAKTSSKVFIDARINKIERTLLSIEKRSAMIVLPLVVRDETLGVMAIYYKDPHFFSKEEFGILDMTTRFLAGSLFNFKAFESLSAEQQKTAYIINSLYDGLIVYDLKGKITAINRRGEELIGMSAKDFFSRASLQEDKTLRQAQVEKASLALIDIISSLELSDFESREITINEPEKRVFAVSLVPVVGERKLKEGSMRIIHDLTKEGEIEQLKRSFVAVASHQLRTPLTGVKWTLNAFVQGEFGSLAEDQKKFLKRSYDAINRLIDIVNDLLTVARIDKERFEFAPALFDIYDLLTEEVKELDAAIALRKGAVRVEVGQPKEALPKIASDRNLVKVVLQNVIDNAIKYTPRGAIKIEVYLENIMQKSVVISVKDNGIGIPRNDIKHIFTKFFRASNAAKASPDGSGLGLFIAKEIISRLNGKIWAESVEGEGSTFYIMLPIGSNLEGGKVEGASVIKSNTSDEKKA